MGILTSIASKLQALVGSAPDIDKSKVFVLFPFFLVFLIGFTVGKSRAVVSLLSLYIAVVLMDVFPFKDELREALGAAEPGWVYGGLLLAFFIIVFIILHHSFLQRRLDTSEAPVPAIVAVTLVEVGFLMSMAFAVGIFTSTMPLYDQLHYFFGTKIAQFVWAVLPLVGLMFLRREKRGSSRSV